MGCKGQQLPIPTRNTTTSVSIAIKKKKLECYFPFQSFHFLKTHNLKKNQPHVISSFGDMGGAENHPVQGGSHHLLHLSEYILPRGAPAINFSRPSIPKS